MIAGTKCAIASSAQTLTRTVFPFSKAPAPAAPAAATQPGDHPSYLSAETFVLALVGSLTGTRLAKDQPVPTIEDVQSAIQALPPSKIKSALLTSLMTAQGNFDAFRKNMATWFDDSMERLSGAYKRHLKLISILAGFVVAVIINADTFAVGYALWSNPALRAQMVQVATETVAKGLPKTPEKPTPPAVANAFRDANDSLRPMLPLGWPNSKQRDQTWLLMALTKLAGWFVTALALSLGAPFWFDTLSKFVNIRGASVKPDRADAKKTN